MSHITSDHKTSHLDSPSSESDLVDGGLVGISLQRSSLRIEACTIDPPTTPAQMDESERRIPSTRDGLPDLCCEFAMVDVKQEAGRITRTTTHESWYDQMMESLHTIERDIAERRLSPDFDPLFTPAEMIQIERRVVRPFERYASRTSLLSFPGDYHIIKSVSEPIRAYGPALSYDDTDSIIGVKTTPQESRKEGIRLQIPDEEDMPLPPWKPSPVPVPITNERAYYDLAPEEEMTLAEAELLGSQSLLEQPQEPQDVDIQAHLTRPFPDELPQPSSASGVLFANSSDSVYAFDHCELPPRSYAVVSIPPAPSQAYYRPEPFNIEPHFEPAKLEQMERRALRYTSDVGQRRDDESVPSLVSPESKIGRGLDLPILPASGSLPSRSAISTPIVLDLDDACFGATSKSSDDSDSYHDDVD